ncbi:hypothetical protein HOLleu_30657 [Holothuria leucospilota]|uniref:NADH dehydrogenase [ubiquinone] 1 subunit C2 n=1 Tax=Holothuria leucospilota TaxID=206669 RepID=A0A9Q1BKQ3_HOLLE|nr:hypothetical protein HOLleu_30657 [Holothuria leucospilota]
MEIKAPERLAGEIPVMNKWTFIGALFGVTSALTYNGLQRRPAIASIHRHFIGILIGSYLGYKLGQFQDRKWAEKQFIIEDYRKRNADIFDDEPVKKKGEIHKPFAPVR